MHTYCVWGHLHRPCAQPKGRWVFTPGAAAAALADIDLCIAAVPLNCNFIQHNRQRPLPSPNSSRPHCTANNYCHHYALVRIQKHQQDKKVDP